MTCMRRCGFVGLVLVLAGVLGCPPKGDDIIPEPDYSGQLPDGEMALVKIDPSQYPDFSEAFAQRKGLEQAARYSLEYLAKPSSQQFFPYLDVTHDRAVVSIEALIDVINTAQSGDELNQMICDRFEVYQSRGAPQRQETGTVYTGKVLFTGYYRPIFDARMKPDAEFRYPLFKRPDDLALNPATGVYGNASGGAYLKRPDIEHGALAGKGLELCYLSDRFETYIVTVQGSGRLRMADGSFLDIGYHGDNGREYKSVGQYLVDNGLISANELSLQGLIRFFKENPQQLDPALAVNPRYVFFTPRTGGPYGSLNVPVTPFRSIATDKEVYPRACTAFLVTNVPARSGSGAIRQYAYRGFAMDQDTGGAIRAAGRCDFFLGTGPEVGELAGRTFSTGKLYYIFVKP